MKRLGRFIVNILQPVANAQFQGWLTAVNQQNGYALIVRLQQRERPS